jgi:hypothetical protein
MKTLKRISKDMYLIMCGEIKVGSLQKSSGVKVVAHYNERYTCWSLLLGGKHVNSGSFDRMKKLALQ